MFEQMYSHWKIWLNGEINHAQLFTLCNRAGSPEAGAISTFSGTTRNNFNGKKVLKLEYEAYVPMAIKEMYKICKEIRTRWEVIKIAMIHRIGTRKIK